MPTNLPPDYFEADKRFRQAETTAEKIACLEEMYSLVPKHKGTDHLRADMRRQLSKLKNEAQTRKKQAGRGSVYQIEREGAGTAVLIGPTNTGKSSLLKALTNAAPEVSPAPYTTWTPTPGMMSIENIQVQLVDTPPLDRDFTEAALFDLARRADLILLVVDLQSDPLDQIEKTLAILHEYRIVPLALKHLYLEDERLRFIPVITLVNKCDDEDQDENFDLLCELFEGECPLMPISAERGRYFDELKRVVFERLNVVRVFAKPPGMEPDLERPFVLKQGSTVEELAAKVHRDFYNNLKTARVWGSSAFDGQPVPRDYVLQDGDIVELKT